MMVNSYIEFEKKILCDYIKLIMDKKFNKEVFDSLLDVYIQNRYYNVNETKYKKLDVNINYYMKLKATEMIDEYGKDIVRITFYLFKYILYLDNVFKDYNIKDIALELDEYRTTEIELYDNDFIDKFSSLVKENEKKKDGYFKGFKSDKFNLDILNTNKDDVKYTELMHDIKFDKIYSDYSINKVYNTGIVNEQKLFITYYMVSNLILKNVIYGDFDSKYIVDFPCTLFEKKEKINRLINIIDNDVVRNNIILKFSYSDYLKNKEKINEWIKLGFMILVVIDDKFNYDDESKMWLKIFSYIITEDFEGNFDKEKLITIEK